MIDETHTFSAGPGGATEAWGLEPDIVTIGKAIAGGIPIGAFGLSRPLARSLLARIGEDDADIVDVGGIGGTLAGNALSTAAARATWSTSSRPRRSPAWPIWPDAWPTRWNGPSPTTRLPWSVSLLGARSEYRFCAPAPVNGSASARAEDGALNEFLHLYMSNRGVLITPFHNMILTCPDTTLADVDLHGELFSSALDALTG